MYSLIKEHADSIIQDIGSKHVQQYDFLMSNLKSKDVSTNTQFQEVYKNYWAMNAARLNPSFIIAYFGYLENNKRNFSINIEEVCDYLYSIPTDKQGEKSLQFSFASKLVHMISPILPIYDKRIREFYFLPTEQSSRDLKFRIQERIWIYEFLRDEYRRIIKDSLLKEPITKFRYQLKPATFTDEKIIDSLIWGFASNAGSSLLARIIQYK